MDHGSGWSTRYVQLPHRPLLPIKQNKWKHSNQLWKQIYANPVSLFWKYWTLHWVVPDNSLLEDIGSFKWHCRFQICSKPFWVSRQKQKPRHAGLEAGFAPKVNLPDSGDQSLHSWCRLSATINQPMVWQDAPTHGIGQGLLVCKNVLRYSKSAAGLHDASLKVLGCLRQRLISNFRRWDPRSHNLQEFPMNIMKGKI